MRALRCIGNILLYVVLGIGMAIAWIFCGIIFVIVAAWELFWRLLGCVIVIAIIVAVIATAVWLGVHGLHLP